MYNALERYVKKSWDNGYNPLKPTYKETDEWCNLSDCAKVGILLETIQEKLLMVESHLDNARVSYPKNIPNTFYELQRAREELAELLGYELK